MTTYERGDVVLVPFPFSDLSRTKRRPALVISSDAYNRVSNDIVIAQITSNVNAPPLPGDHRVHSWAKAGLLAPSLVRSRLTTVHASLPTRVLGRMPEDDIRSIDRAIASALGL